MSSTLFHGNAFNKLLISNGRLPNITHVGGSHISLTLFGIKKNCLISGRSLLYQFIKWAINLTVIIIIITAINFIENFIKYPSLKVKTIHR
jgi:hypothetical protein